MQERYLDINYKRKPWTPSAQRNNTHRFFYFNLMVHFRAQGSGIQRSITKKKLKKSEIVA